MVLVDGYAAAGSLENDNCESLHLPVPLRKTWIRCRRHFRMLGAPSVIP